MRKITKTKHFSYKVGNLPKGCQQCVKGRKLVLFITGVCSNNCSYCPLSDTRKDKDFVWANEWKVGKKADVVKEAKISSSKGAGITGGDPLMKLDRTISHIKMLKNAMGDDYHIHLYAPLSLVTKKRIENLYNSGLDEIRLHPDLDNEEDWKRIEVPLKYGWDVGLEIPAIPNKIEQTKRLIDYVKDKVKFININELEMTDNNACSLVDENYVVKNRLSCAVKGSEKTAKDLLKYIAKTKLNAHYCSAKLKDAVQLKNRIKLRANNVKKKYDKVTSDGTLLRGAIYLKDLIPDADYRIKLQMIDRKSNIKKLFKVKRELQSKWNIGINDADVDVDKMRVTLSKDFLRKIKSDIKQSKLVPAIVEEYPTYDGLEVEITFL